ncbi:CYTH domain-containing protein [Cytobacillus sp. Hm23]
MTQEIEIEFKNILTKNEFNNMLNAFSINNTHFKSQINYYFDTNDFALKSKASALRIRLKENQYMLTLKQPAKVGLLETHQPLTDDQAQGVLHNDFSIQGEVLQQLKKLHVPIHEIKYFGSLSTNRAEIIYEGGTLVFDHSHYLSKDDYEIEYEVKNYETGFATFQKLLSKFQIPVRKTENKIQRFYNYKVKKKDKKNIEES